MNSNQFNPKDFINQYGGTPNVLGNSLLGGGIGAGAGAGLAALFGKLTGAYNPALGAIVGGFGGAIPGLWIGSGVTHKNRITDRMNAFNALTPEQQQLVDSEWASQMDLAVGDTSFTEWLKRNPQALRQFMLNDM
jgi:phage tail tape-measure protein